MGGTAAHTAIQKARAAADKSYAKEVSLKVPVRLVDEDWQLQGRDGQTRSESGEHIVEEYKTSRGSQPTLRAIDEAQAWLYAGMLCHRDPDIPRVCARVIYLTPQGDVLRVFEHTHAFRGVALFSLRTQVLRHIFACNRSKNKKTRSLGSKSKFPLRPFSKKSAGHGRPCL